MSTTELALPIVCTRGLIPGEPSLSGITTGRRERMSSGVRRFARPRTLPVSAPALVAPKPSLTCHAIVRPPANPAPLTRGRSGSSGGTPTMCDQAPRS